jgi:hypothetical protein
VGESDLYDATKSVSVPVIEAEVERDTIVSRVQEVTKVFVKEAKVGLALRLSPADHIALRRASIETGASMQVIVERALQAELRKMGYSKL